MFANLIFCKMVFFPLYKDTDKIDETCAHFSTKCFIMEFMIRIFYVTCVFFFTYIIYTIYFISRLCECMCVCVCVHFFQNISKLYSSYITNSSRISYGKEVSSALSCCDLATGLTLEDNGRGTLAQKFH